MGVLRGRPRSGETGSRWPAGGALIAGRWPGRRPGPEGQGRNRRPLSATAALLAALAGCITVFLRYPVPIGPSGSPLSLFPLQAGLAFSLMVTQGLPLTLIYSASFSLTLALDYTLGGMQPAAALPFALLYLLSLVGASLAGRQVLETLAQHRPGVARQRFVAGYIVAGLVVVPLVSTLVGLLMIPLVPKLEYDWEVVERLFLAKVLGVAAVAPPFLFGLPTHLLRGRWPVRLRREQLAWLALTVAVISALIFALPLGLADDTPAGLLRLLHLRFLFYPLLVWSALRFGLGWTSLGVTIICDAYLLFNHVLIGAKPALFESIDLWLLAAHVVVLQLICLLLAVVVQERRRTMRRLARQLNRDWMTGLPDYRGLAQRLERAPKAAEGQEATLGILKLHRVDRLWSTLGLRAQVELLRGVTAELLAELPPQMFLAHVPMGNFVLLTEQSAPATVPALQRLLQSVAALRFDWGEESLRPFPSLGAVSFTPGDRPLEALLADASHAAALALDNGASTVHLEASDSEHRKAHRVRWKLAGEVLDALERGAVALWCQPLVALRGEERTRHVAYEILMRLRGHDDRLIAPISFLEALEESGKMQLADRLVLATTVRFLASHPEVLGRTRWFSLNLSGTTVDDPGFVDFLASELAATGVPAQKLCFEVTETAAISRLSHATETLLRIRALGCYTALDDFGVGLSSFQYLKSLPVDLLKIDGNFVRKLRARTPDYVIVKSITEVAQQMGLETAAEFVESSTAVACLEKLGVDFAQGSFYGSAAPIEDWLLAEPEPWKTGTGEPA